MKKIIVLIFCLLFLSGCDVTYKITLNNNKVKENLTLIETNKELFDKEMDSGWTLRDSFESLTTTDEFSYEDYEVKSLTTSDQLGVEYSSNSALSILNSSILNQCYSNPTMEKNDDIVSISTGSDFECYEYYENLETIKVVFKTNHEVVSTNADSFENGEYVWNITRDSNKDIQISYYDSKVNDNKEIIVIIMSIIIVGVLVVIGYFIKKKIEKANGI